MVGAVVAKLHLHGFGACCKPQQLMTQADTKQRARSVSRMALNGRDGIITGFRIARSIGQKHPVRRFMRQRPRPQVWCAGTTVKSDSPRSDQHAQNVALHTVVIGNHVPWRNSATHNAAARCIPHPCCRTPHRCRPISWSCTVTSLARSMPLQCPAKPRALGQCLRLRDPRPRPPSGSRSGRPCHAAIRVRRRVSISAMATMSCSLPG